jgi:polyhydroxyalkanoate synthesis repressor PhaR
MRTIKRYSNRKLYDTQDSHYVTLQQLAVLVRNGDDIRVVDKGTQRDLTTATLSQIIFEEEKRGPRLPVSELRQIIQTGQIR